MALSLCKEALQRERRLSLPNKSSTLPLSLSYLMQWLESPARQEAAAAYRELHLLVFTFSVAGATEISEYLVENHYPVHKIVDPASITTARSARQPVVPGRRPPMYVLAMEMLMLACVRRTHVIGAHTHTVG